MCFLRALVNLCARYSEYAISQVPCHLVNTNIYSMRISFFIFLVLSTFLAYAQVGINTDQPQGALDITHSDLGLVVPRVSSVNQVTNGNGGAPADGTIVYDNARKAMMFRVDGVWLKLALDASGKATLGALSDQALQKYTYVKASNTDNSDRFGYNIAISGDGSTLAVGARYENSNATGINGDDSNNSAADAGAVYIYVNTDGVWTQQAYIKASNTQASDLFGTYVSLSDDGNTLAVGATGEDSNSTGVNGFQFNNSTSSAGAAYVFVRTDTTWTQQAYVKASNPDAFDNFGRVVSLSGDGKNLAVGASDEDSDANGINGNQLDNTASGAGAVYMFVRNGSTWSQQAYIKATNSDASDSFGETAIEMSTDGNTLVIAADGEDSNATGINGNQLDNSYVGAGAVYVYIRIGTTWLFQAYIKASNTDSGDDFGEDLGLSDDGSVLVVGAWDEDSNATGVEGDQTNNSIPRAGALYVFRRNVSIWSQEAYIKASNPGDSDYFGFRVALSGDGKTFCVGAQYEDSNAREIDGNENNNSALSSGAAYIFRKSGAQWFQESYVKASNTDGNDQFGNSLDVNKDGSIIIISADREDSSAIGIGGNQSNNSVNDAGAVYVIE